MHSSSPTRFTLWASTFRATASPLRSKPWTTNVGRRGCLGGSVRGCWRGVPCRPFVRRPRCVRSGCCPPGGEPAARGGRRELADWTGPPRALLAAADDEQAYLAAARSDPVRSFRGTPDELGDEGAGGHPPGGTSFPPKSLSSGTSAVPSSRRNVVVDSTEPYWKTCRRPHRGHSYTS